MNAQLGAIVWKEWRELRWKAVGLAATVVGIYALCLTTIRHKADAIVIAPLFTQMLVVPVGALFLAMGAAAGERSAGTLGFLRSRPIPLRTVAAVKLIGTILAVASAQALSVCLAWGIAATAEATRFEFANGVGTRLVRSPALFDLGHWVPNQIVLGLLVTTSVVLWVVAPGVNRRKEVSAAAAGLVAVVGSWVVVIGTMWIADTLGFDIGQRGRPSVWVAAMPLGVSALAQESSSAWPLFPDGFFALLIFAASHLVLAWWYVARFGHIAAERTQERSSVAAAGVTLGAPRRSPLAALLWKHGREATPTTLVGVLCAMGVVTAFAVLVVSNEPQVMFGTDNYSVQQARETRQGIAATAIGWLAGMGSLAAIVIGVGIPTSDLRPGLATFWRSRPIRTDQWFWTTAVVAIAQLALAFVLPSYALLLWLRSEEVAWANEATAALGVAIVALAFASAFFCGCVSRKSVLAAVMAFALGLALFVGASQADEWARKWPDWGALMFLPICVGVAACVAAVVAGLVGSLSKNQLLGVLAAASVFGVLVRWVLQVWTEASWWPGSPMADTLVLLVGVSAALVLAAWLAVRRDWAIGRG